MKIRTQLILAFLLLSVLPLTGIVLYSYFSSQQAVRRAQHHEAEEMAKQMDRRVAEVRREVGSRLALLGDRSFGTILRDAPSGEVRAQVAGRLLAEMGDAAPFVESIELIPHAPPAPSAEALEVLPPPPAPRPARVVQVLPTPSVAGAHPVASVPPVPPTRVVINIDEVLRNVGRSLEQSGFSFDGAEQVELQESIRRAAEVAGKVAEQHAGLSREWEVAFEQAFETRAEEIEASIGVSEAARELQQVIGKPEVDARDKARQEQALARARRRLEESQKRNAEAHAEVREKTAVGQAPNAAVTVEPAPSKKQDQTKILFGKELQLPIERDGEVIGEIRPRLRAGMLVESILGASERGSDEIPFAVDPEGNLYTADEPSRETVQELGITTGGTSRRVLKNWVVATSRDEESGLTLGIARRIREPLAEVRRAAGRNFAYGMVLIGFALIGIMPIANHMTRDVEMVTLGAERIAQGDLDTEVPVRSSGEFGALAVAFNRMARDLRDHQDRLVEQERLRKEDEIQRRLFSAEFDRKSGELEEARRFQLSLLPKQIPQLPGLSIAVHVRTATEVGGDYYDFHVEGDEELTIAVGDATGHGATAGTMVTIVKSLFTTFVKATSPSAFLTDAGERIRGMDLGRMSMALLLARIADSKVILSSAGMPPALLYRGRTRTIEELASIGMPLGTLTAGYSDLEASLEPGDALLLMSDGFPELLDGEGEPLGYPAAEELFRAVAEEGPEEIVRHLAAAADERTGGAPPNDDITFVVVKVGEGGGGSGAFAE